jgi:hypothetical protein
MSELLIFDHILSWFCLGVRELTLVLLDRALYWDLEDGRECVWISARVLGISGAGQAPSLSFE